MEKTQFWKMEFESDKKRQLKLDLFPKKLCLNSWPVIPFPGHKIGLPGHKNPLYVTWQELIDHFNTQASGSELPALTTQTLTLNTKRLRVLTRQATRPPAFTPEGHIKPHYLISKHKIHLNKILYETIFF